MEYRDTIFYLALLVVVGCLAELYVRMKGIGGHTDKVRGVSVAKKPKLFPPFALMIAAIVVAAVTIPR